MNYLLTNLRGRSSLLALLGAASLTLLAAPARADEVPPPSAAQKAAAAATSAKCTVRTIHALPSGSDFDTQLQTIQAQLKSPALASWKSFRLLKQYDLTVPRDPPAKFALPAEHEGALAFVGEVEKDNRRRLRLRLQLNDGRARLQSIVYVIDNGGTVLHAGTKHDGGMLILGITCHL